MFQEQILQQGIYVEANGINQKLKGATCGGKKLKQLKTHICKIKSIPLIFHLFLDITLFKQRIVYFIKYPIKLKNRFHSIMMYKIRGGGTRKRKPKEASYYLQRTVRKRALRFYTKKKTLHSNSIHYPSPSFNQKESSSLFSFSCSVLFFSSLICHSFFQDTYRAPRTYQGSSENRPVKTTKSLHPQGDYCLAGKQQ